MRWLGSIEIKENGVWSICSAVRETYDDALTWVNSKVVECRANRLKFRHKKVIGYYKPTRQLTYDPGQFEFLHGNEACAREWQDAQMDLRKIK